HDSIPEGRHCDLGLSTGGWISAARRIPPRRIESALFSQQPVRGTAAGAAYDRYWRCLVVWSKGRRVVIAMIRVVSTALRSYLLDFLPLPPSAPDSEVLIFVCRLLGCATIL